MAIPVGHPTRAVQCAKNIKIARGWLADEPLSKIDAKLILDELKATSDLVKELVARD